jgi:hypothetical protein
MEFSTFLEQTDPADVLVDVKLPNGTTVCTLTLRPCDRAQLDTLRKQAQKSVVNPKTRASELQLDDGKLREGLIRQCVVDWAGMTYGSAALAMGRKPKAAATAERDVTLSFTVDTAVRVLSAMIGIEDLIWTAALQRVEAETKAEAEEKNG